VIVQKTVERSFEMFSCSGILRLKRQLTSRRLHYNLTVMALSDNGLVSDPHATIDITVHDTSFNDMPDGQSRPHFTQKLYQMNISEDALNGAHVGTVSTTHCKFLFFFRHKKLILRVYKT